MTLHISRSNSKVDCPNISLPPILTCPKNMECAEYCYDLNSMRQYPQVSKARMENLELWNTDPTSFEAQLIDHLRKRHNQDFFRFHVGGDIPSIDYLLMMERVAWAFPATRFLAYTKTHYRANQPNLTLIKSNQLDDHTLDPHRPTALIERRPNTIPTPSHAFLRCPGKCGPCGHHCWSMVEGEAVIFHLHGTKASKFKALA